jgi:D-sedoheptulose 7-phosphate isomerase
MGDLLKSKTVSAATAPAAKDYLESTRELLARLDYSVVDRMADDLWTAYQEDRSIYFFGNGGSAALASHLACDVAKSTIIRGKRRFRAISLADNVPLMTAWANDFAYQDIFAEPLAGLVRKDDRVFAISGSGNSMNVVRGLEVAREVGAKTLALTGYEGGRVRGLADLCLIVPSNNMQQIEDAHLCSAHAIFTALRQRMEQLGEA